MEVIGFKHVTVGNLPQGGHELTLTLCCDGEDLQGKGSGVSLAEAIEETFKNALGDMRPPGAHNAFTVTCVDRGNQFSLKVKTHGTSSKELTLDPSQDTAAKTLAKEIVSLLNQPVHWDTQRARAARHRVAATA